MCKTASLGRWYQNLRNKFRNQKVKLVSTAKRSLMSAGAWQRANIWTESGENYVLRSASCSRNRTKGFLSHPKHTKSRKLQKYRMETIRALTAQTKHRFTRRSRFWPSSDRDRSLYLLLECLQLEKRWYQMALPWHNLATSRTFTRNPENSHWANIWGRERVFGDSGDVMGRFKKKKNLSWITEPWT